MAKEYKEKKVALSEATNNKLDKLSELRNAGGNFCYRKKDIVEQLINQAHKREVK